MANKSLACSSRRRNAILKIFSSNGNYLENHLTFLENPPPFFLQELHVLVGLAFTAVLAQGTEIDVCRPALNVFLEHRQCYGDVPDHLVTAITLILRKGLLAFQFLGLPYYYDDFVEAYHHVLKATSPISPKIKLVMRQIFIDVF